MKISFKRVAALLISGAMLAALAPAAFAEDGEEAENAVMTPAQAEELDLVAFPGAEGGGKYTTGGRGGEVYHVTNLNDDGEGSLRDAVSQPNRTVVFDVSGTIYLNSRLSLTQPNITLAGQTAPGDGICLANYNISIEADNVIVRYMRFRPGGATDTEDDAISSRYHSNIIFDHCSSSWSTDETLSIYATANTTVQWCIASESLTLGSHAKGRHGYGGIWGGYNASYHHNLIATHTSRTPRFGSLSSTHPDYEGVDGNDMVNNVIYNWGFNNAYGGENVTLNVINNYYKPGAITLGNIKGQFFNPSNGAKLYMSGNVMEGNDEVTADNSLGFNPGGSTAVLVSEPNYEHLYPLDNVDTAQEAYKKVLAEAGATLPKRDSYDSKIINDVKNGTGRFVNNEKEVGGWPVLNTFNVKADTDGDGMPDEWEKENGFNESDPSDGRAYAENGYTNLENYLNSIVENGALPQNPTVSVDLGGYAKKENQTLKNSVFAEDSPITVEVNATPEGQGRRIEKLQLFVDDIVVAESSKYDLEYDIRGLTPGQHYISAKAVDSAGETTTSEVKEVNIIGTGSVLPWRDADIGEVEIPGSASLKDGVYTVTGAGLIGPGNEWSESPEDIDSFHYMYDSIDENGEISAQIIEAAKLTNNCVSGLMIRDELTESADFAMIDYEFKKMGAGLVFAFRKDGKYSREEMTLDTLPRYIRLQKQGGKIGAFHSTNGVDWILFGETELDLSGTNYAGIAVDGCREDNQNPTYSYGKFANLKLENYGANAIPDIEMRTGTMGEQNGINQSVFNWQDKSLFDVGDSVELKISSSELESASKIEIYLDGVLNQTVDEPREIETVKIDEPGNHYITAVIYDADGAKNSATQNVGVSKVENGWKISEIHYPKDIQANGTMICHGAFDLSGENLRITGTGYGIEGVENEEYPMMYREMTGDFEISFKVDPQSLASYEQMGFTVRNSLDPQEDGTSYAAYFQIYNGELFRKTSEYGKTYDLIGQQKYKKTPTWIRLKKTGKTLKMDYSQNGTDWIDVGTEENADINDSYYLSVFGASNEEFKISEFSISEFSLKTSESAGYVDLAGYDWAVPAINALTDAGVLNGEVNAASGERYFLPGNNVTRAEFAKMLVGAAGIEVPTAVLTDKEFADVDGSAWYAPYIYAAYAGGLVQGTSDTTFEPDASITREEMAVMISRAQAADVPDLTELPYGDTAEISDWAVDGVVKVTASDIMQGDENNLFAPRRLADRAEAATVIYRIMNGK